MAFETHTHALGLRSADILHAQWRPKFYERRDHASLLVRGGGRGAAARAAAAASPAAASVARGADDVNAPARFAYTPAHLVVVDRQERSVVLVVRGSLELADVLADMQVWPPSQADW